MQLKKIITLLLVVALTVAGFALGVSAASANELNMAVEVKSSAAISKDPLAVRPGDTVDVSLKITKNPGLVLLKFAFNYDTTALELVSQSTPDLFTSVEKTWVDESDDGKIWYVAYSSDYKTPVTKTGAVVNFTFKVKNSFDGEIAFSVTDYEKDIVVGDNYDTDVVVNVVSDKILAHKYGEVVSTRDNCLQPGVITAKCTKPGCDHVLELIKPAEKAHDLVGPTCTEQEKCQNEGCTYLGKGPTDHTYVWTVETESSLFSEGLEVGTCSECGAKTERALPASLTGTELTIAIVIVIVVAVGAAGLTGYFIVTNKKKAAN